MLYSYLDEDYSLMYVTCSKLDEAKEIAKTLVEEKLAACVSIIPDIISVYRWDGKVHQEGEVLLKIKTRESLFTEVSEKIMELHSATLPEIISVEIQDATDDYKKWLFDETDK